MTMVDSPDFMSVSEAIWLRWLMAQGRRPNLLVLSPDLTVDAAATGLTGLCDQPLHARALPGPLQLPVPGSGTLLLRDVACLTLDQQIELYDWMNDHGRDTQLISIASVPLLPLVKRGHFLEGLFYRINTIYLVVAREA
jgi:hypothetical protein